MNEQKTVVKKKKRRMKPRVMDILCLVSGIVIGQVIAMLTQNVGFLAWLGYDVVLGFVEPIEFSLVIFKFAIGFSIHLNPAVVLFALLGLFASRYFFPSAKKTQKIEKTDASIENEAENESEGFEL